MMIEVKRLTNVDEDKVREIAEVFYSENGNSGYNASFLLNKRNYLLAAYRDGELAGSLLGYELERLEGESPMMFIYTIDVLPEHRRKGVARSLINELKGLCASRGFMKMFVITNETNIPAMSLYASTGGERTAEDDVVIVYRKRGL